MRATERRDPSAISIPAKLPPAWETYYGLANREDR